MPHQTNPKTSFRSWIRVLCGVIVLLPLLAPDTVGLDRPRGYETSIFSKCWDYRLIPNLSLEIASDASSVFVPDIENSLHAIDLSTGNKVWSSEFGGDVISNLLIVNDSIVFGTNSHNAPLNSPARSVIRAVSRQTGITLWQTDIAASTRLWLGEVHGNAVAVGADGWASSLSRSDGKIIWTSELGSGVAADPLFREADIRIGTRNNEVVGLDSQSGKVRKIWKSDHAPTAFLNDAAGRLLIGDDRGNLTAISADGNRLWNFRNGAQISSVLEYEAEYVAASYDNFIYKLSRGGNVEWKRRLPGRVNGRVLLLGHTAVIAIVGTGSVYGVNLRNGKISNRIESGEEVSLMVAGNRDGTGFIMSGPRGLSYYGSKCPSK